MSKPFKLNPPPGPPPAPAEIPATPTKTNDDQSVNQKREDNALMKTPDLPYPQPAPVAVPYKNLK